MTDSIRILKHGGTIVTIVGVPDGDFVRRQGLAWYWQPVLNLMNAKVRSLCRKQQVHYQFVLARSDGSQLTEISRLVDRGRIQPVIDRVFPFEQVSDALVYLQAGRAKGKVVAKVK